MKKLILLFAILGYTSLLHAQQTIFSEFEGQEGVTSITILKPLLNLMETLPGDDEADVDFSVIKDKLDEFHMLVAEDDIVPQVRRICKQIKRESKLQSLMKIVEDDEVIEFLFGKEGSKNRLLMVIDSEDEIIVFNLIGDFSIKDIQKIAAESE